MEQEILSELQLSGFVEMETEDSCLDIRLRKFFSSGKEFLFVLNGKAVYGCKGKSTALKKIREFIGKGFNKV